MAVRSKPRLPSRLEKKPRRTISTEPHPMFERVRLFLFSAYAGQSPRAGDPPAPLFLGIRICELARHKSFILHTYKKDGSTTPVASRTLPIRSNSSGPLHYRALRRKIVCGPSSASETSPLFSVSNQM